MKGNAIKFKCWVASFMLSLVPISVLGAVPIEAIFVKQGTLLGKKTYSVILREGVRQTRIELGDLRRKPSGFFSQDGQTLWVLALARGEAIWQLRRYAASDGKLLAEVDLGKPGSAGIWVGSSLSGTLIHATTRENRKRYLTTFDVGPDDNLQPISKVKIPHSTRNIASLAYDKVLIVARGTKTELQLIDTVSGAKEWDTTLKHGVEPKLAIDQERKTLYVLQSRMVASKVEQRDGSQFAAPITGVTVVNAQDGNVAFDQLLGFDLSEPFIHPGNRYLYAASRASLEQAGATVWRLGGDGVAAVRQTDQHCRPTRTVVAESTNEVTLICADRVVHFSADTEQGLSLEARTNRAFYGTGSSAYYVDDANRLGKLELSPLRHVGTISPASVGAKIGQGVGRTVGFVVLGAIAAQTGILYVPVSYANYGGPLIAGKFNDIGAIKPARLEVSISAPLDGEYVYALAPGTREVAHIRWSDFSLVRRTSLSGAPLGLVQYLGSPMVFAISNNQVNAFDPNDDTQVGEISGDRLLAISPTTRKIYFATDDRLVTYDMDNFAPLDQREPFDGVYAVVTHSERQGPPVYVAARDVTTTLQ